MTYVNTLDRGDQTMKEEGKHITEVQDIWDKKFCTDDNFIVRDICGEYVLIATGESQIFGNSMISLNETYVSLWKLFSGDLMTREVFDRIREEYEGPEDKIRNDIIRFVIESRNYGLLKEM